MGVASLRSLLNYFGLVLVEVICGFVGIVLVGLPGLIVGLLGGAVIGAWLFDRSSQAGSFESYVEELEARLFETSSQVRHLENRVAELEAKHERKESV